MVNLFFVGRLVFVEGLLEHFLLNVIVIFLEFVDFRSELLLGGVDKGSLLLLLILILLNIIDKHLRRRTPTLHFFRPRRQQLFILVNKRQSIPSIILPRRFLLVIYVIGLCLVHD